MDVYGKRTSSVFKLNDSYVFVLLVINAQTKMVYLRPLRGKGGKEVAEALKEIFTIDIRSNIEGFSDILLHCDHGKEFLTTLMSRTPLKSYTCIPFG